MRDYVASRVASRPRPSHTAASRTRSKEFKRNGLSDLITCTHGDACQGFGPGLDGAADAVFLDLPSPWLAVHHAAKCLRIGGRLCSYSPCIEQVQRTCTALRASGFTGACRQ